MLHLIPSVKTLNIKSGFLRKKAISFSGALEDGRLIAALTKLPQDDAGAELEIELTGDAGEEYELWIGEVSVKIRANGAAGAFYAIQSLRQLFKSPRVPCL